MSSQTKVGTENGARLSWHLISTLAIMGLLANAAYFGGHWLHSQGIIGQFALATLVTMGVLLSAAGLLVGVPRWLSDVREVIAS